jgi:hypothetical protein
MITYIRNPVSHHIVLEVDSTRLSHIGGILGVADISGNISYHIYIISILHAPYNGEYQHGEVLLGLHFAQLLLSSCNRQA